MKKIMIIGCPGSGKSRLSKLLGKKLNVPVLHLDYIYHIDNFKQISRDELKEMVSVFTSSNDKFIIDGNYNGTMAWRTQFCDTVILLDIETEICVQNVISRMEEVSRDDMAPDFDNSIMDDNFIEFVRNFKNDKLPEIKALLDSKKITQIILKNYEDIQNFIDQY